jgi:hypothetical protein
LEGPGKRTESERKRKRPGLSDRLDTPEEGRRLRIGRDDLRLDGSEGRGRSWKLS